jgi:hypothetical protein
VLTSSNLLSQIFKHDIAKEKSSVGSILDQAKDNILANSWQCKNQESLLLTKRTIRVVFST